MNNNVLTWCKQKGIIIDSTTLYTSQLNGKAERLNRTILDKIRALLFDSRFNKEMWGKALYSSIYILNRIRYSTDTLLSTPYEMWEKRKPNAKLFQIFGSIAYAKKLDH